MDRLNGKKNVLEFGSELFSENNLYENGQLFDKWGFAKDGYNKEGFDSEGYNRGGYDQQGFDRLGFDRYGMNKDGYDKYGCNRKNYNIEGYDQYGYDIFGFTKEGFDLEGYDRTGDYQLFINYYLNIKGIVFSEERRKYVFNERVKEILKNLYFIETRLVLYNLYKLNDSTLANMDEKNELKKARNVLINTIKLHIKEKEIEQNHIPKLFLKKIEKVEPGNKVLKQLLLAENKKNQYEDELYNLLEESLEIKEVLSTEGQKEFTLIYKRLEQIILEWIKIIGK